MRKLILTTALLMVGTSAFAAEYYIVQNPTPKDKLRAGLLGVSYGSAN
jgi:hypothetical protein